MQDQELGRGGFAIVYAGRYQRRPVAIKILSQAASAQAASEFQNEMALLAHVQGHPNVLRLIGSTTVVGRPSIITERCAEVRHADGMRLFDETSTVPGTLRLG